MPGSDFYEVSSMTLMKRGDGYDPTSSHKAVKFQFSYDDGKTWHTHNNGKWYATG
jgi:hypothetical protein